MKLIKKSRNWIKGHFIMGIFYGLCFGIGLGFFFALTITQSFWFIIVLIILGAPLTLGLEDLIEENEFSKN